MEGVCCLKFYLYNKAAIAVHSKNNKLILNIMKIRIRVNMALHHKFLSVVCITGVAFCCSQIYASSALQNTSSLQVVSGEATYQGQEAILLVSHDNAKSWKLLAPFTALSNFEMSGYNFNSLSCSDNICAAAGFYDTNNASSDDAAITFSNNQWQDWKTITPFISMQNIKEPSWMGASCYAKTCAVVGYFEDVTTSARQGMIVMTNDAGQTWNSLFPLASLPNSQSSLLNAVSCTNGVCVAVGNYREKDSQDPKNSPAYYQMMLLASTDQGKSWNTTIPLQHIPNMTNANLSIYCSDNTCLSAGYYNQGTGNQAVMLRTHDQGKTWSLKNPFSSIPAIQSSDLENISCDHSLCFSSGTIVYKGESSKNVVLVSNDLGKNWTPKTPCAAIPNVQACGMGTFSCTHSACMAEGFYRVNDLQSAAIFITRDAGNTWEIKTPLVNEPWGSEAILSSLSCSNDVCVGAGTSWGSGGAATSGNSAVMVVSYDQGKTWIVSDPVHELIPVYSFADLTDTSGTSGDNYSTERGFNNQLKKKLS